MNHGLCYNCWWYKEITGRSYLLSPKGVIEHLGKGRCYMHNGGNTCEGPDYNVVDGECYCPDYINRKRGDREQKMTLDKWIENWKNL